MGVPLQDVRWKKDKPVSREEAVESRVPKKKKAFESDSESDIDGDEDSYRERRSRQGSSRDNYSRDSRDSRNYRDDDERRESHRRDSHSYSRADRSESRDSYYNRARYR